MQNESFLFTVIGVVDGLYSIRIHEYVSAVSAEKAYECVWLKLSEHYAEASPGTKGFIAAAVFNGKVPCLHGRSSNGPWGEDRCGQVALTEEETTLTSMAVVCIDPATKALVLKKGMWSAPGNAERDPQFDFYLIASVLPGDCSPVLRIEKPLLPPESSRNERITAMLRYSKHFAQFFGNKAPMHMPG